MNGQLMHWTGKSGKIKTFIIVIYNNKGTIKWHCCKQTVQTFCCQTEQIRFRIAWVLVATQDFVTEKIYLPRLKFDCPQKCMCLAMTKCIICKCGRVDRLCLGEVYIIH